MRTATQRDRWEFIHLIMKHTTVPEYEAQKAATRLLRYGATLGRIAENQCNGYSRPDSFHSNVNEWDSDLEMRDKRKALRIRERVRLLCASIGCDVIFQGDPRGNTVKITVPDGYTNDWGREGICVPTS